MLKSYFAALPELSAVFSPLLFFIDCCVYHSQTRKPHFQTFKPPSRDKRTLSHNIYYVY